MATVQDLMKQKVIRKVQRSDKGKQHRRKGFKQISDLKQLDNQPDIYALMGKNPIKSKKNHYGK